MKLPIDSVEWDFRALPEHQLSDCIWWEYLRESELNRNTAAKWLKSKSPDAFKGPFNVEVCVILLENPGFPRPWLSIQHPHKGYGSSICATTLEEEFEHLAELQKRNPKVTTDFASKYLAGGKFVFDVNFPEARNLDVILHDFRTWLNAEAKRRGFSRPEGRSAGLPWYRLKNLSALRLARHFAFKESQEILKGLTPVANAANVLPIFSLPNKWTKAKKAAEELIAKQEISHKLK